MHRTDVRNAGGFRRSRREGQSAQHQDHSRLRAESHFGSAQMVSGIEIVENKSEARLVHLARRQRRETAEQLDFDIWRIDVDARSDDRTVLLPLFLRAAT